MIKEIFTRVLNISISAGILIIACMLIRLVFKRMPKYIRCLMWLLVAIRLVIPFSIESPVSMLPAKDYIITENEGSDYQEAALQKDGEVTLVISDKSGKHPVKAESDALLFRNITSIDTLFILSIVWLGGIAVVLTYAFISYIRLKMHVADAVRLRGSIYRSEKIGTAFILGIIRPKIYIPYGLNKNELLMSVNHEKAHILRCDHLIKPLGFIIAAVYWFNPLVWLAYVLLCRDVELACDEKVIKKIGYDKKKDYSQALLNLSIPRKYISACPVAFGEVGINERIKNVLKMKKGNKIIIALAFMLCAALCICFLTYPKESRLNTNDISNAQAAQELENNNSSEQNSEANDQNGEEIQKPVSESSARVSWPLKEYIVITRPYSEDHQGVDFAAPEGTTVMSIFNGTVQDSGCNDTEGNYVVIQNCDGIKCKFAHLQNAASIDVGGDVSTGTAVGNVGSTGNSTGPHLHMEMYDVNGNSIDPLNILPED